MVGQSVRGQLQYRTSFVLLTLGTFIISGVEALGSLIHGLAPGPEIVPPGAPPLHMSAEGTLEGMGVCIDHPGHQQVVIQP